MNKINKLFEEDFVRDLFRQEVLPLYPEVADIGRIKIKPYKKLIWETTYHVVLDFLVEFKLKSGSCRKTHIVCSAHSSEPRDLAFEVLQHLWKRRLGKSVVFPRPLFYSADFRGSFYRALGGKNLLHFILLKDKKTIEDLVIRTAIMFARLHSLAIKEADLKFNPANHQIATVIPGIENIAQEITDRYGKQWQASIIDPYRQCIAEEKKWLASHQERYLIHGDAHTENILRVSKHKVGLIDFTDFALSDFARDVGTFLQQLNYKLETKFFDNGFIPQAKKLFLKHYLQESKQKLTADLQSRINNYYRWTALRTAAYWLLKDKSEPARAVSIITDLEKIKNENLQAQN